MLDNSDEEKIHTKESKDDLSDSFENESAGQMARPGREKHKFETLAGQHTSEHLRIMSIANTPAKVRG